MSTPRSAWRSPRARWRRARACPIRARCSCRWRTATSRPGWRSPVPSARWGSPSPPPSGTAGYLRAAGMVVDTLVAKVGEEGVASDAVELIAQGKVQLVVNTPRGLGPAGRRAAHPHGVGGPQGALPHDACRGPGRRRRHGRRPLAPARGASAPGSAPRDPRARGDGRAALRAPRRAGDRRRRAGPPEPGHDRVGDVGPRYRAGRVRRRWRNSARSSSSLCRSNRGPGTRRPACTRWVRACSTASDCKARGWRSGLRPICPRSHAAGARVVVSIWGRRVADYGRAAEHGGRSRGR